MNVVLFTFVFGCLITLFHWLVFCRQRYWYISPLWNSALILNISLINDICPFIVWCLENFMADCKNCKYDSCNNSYSAMFQLKMVFWLKEDQVLAISLIEVNSFWSVGDKGKFAMVIYYTHLTSVKFARSVYQGSHMTTYDHLIYLSVYVSIYIYK